MKRIWGAAALFTLATAAAAQKITDVHYNQLGFFTGDTSRVILRSAVDTLTLPTIPPSVGRIAGPLDWRAATGAYAYVLDARALYGGDSASISLADDPTQAVAVRWSANPYAAALPAAVKSYTYQRAGVPVEAEWGGPWARPAGHPDTAVRFHRTTDRDTTRAYASPGGWYDAGDYNKYVVNGAFAVGIMLQLAEQYPALLGDGAVGFSESERTNGRGDLLDELKWELDWLLTMQDPADGGVHHKLTTLDFAPMTVMPHEAAAQRYILAKGTAATLDFAACLAQASRVFARAGEGAYAKTLRDAAERAYDWAQKHPDATFRNPPDVRTGEYGDEQLREEWLWARTELFLTTGTREYEPDVWAIYNKLDFKAGENWTWFMRHLAAFSLLTSDRDRGTNLGGPLRGRVVALADSLIAASEDAPYFVPIDDWHWGSSSDVLGAAMLAAQAHRATGDDKYLRAARRWTDWVFGANATGYSFVTGFGRRTPMHIHHRPSAADGVAAPVPGFVVGGPNEYQQDTSNHVTYPHPAGVHPQTSYADQEGSYASNEVCLNWNAPLVYVLGYLTATAE